MAGKIEYFDIGGVVVSNGNTFEPIVPLVREEVKTTSGFLPGSTVLPQSATFKIRLQSFRLIIIEPQDEGGFIATNSEFPGAVGQGETEEEAIRDMEEAIEAIKEELRENP